MLRATARFTKPDDVPMEITISGTLSEFRSLSTALLEGEKLPYYSVRGLVDQISDATHRLNRVVNPDIPETQPED